MMTRDLVNGMCICGVNGLLLAINSGARQDPNGIEKRVRGRGSVPVGIGCEKCHSCHADCFRTGISTEK